MTTAFYFGFATPLVVFSAEVSDDMGFELAIEVDDRLIDNLCVAIYNMAAFEKADGLMPSAFHSDSSS